MARSQVASSGKGLHETSCTHNVAVLQAHVHQCSLFALLLCGFPREVLGPAVAQAFTCLESVPNYC